MIRFLPLVVLVAVVLGVFAYFNFSKPPPQTQTISSIQTPITQPAEDERIKVLEQAVLELAGKTGTPISTTNGKSANQPATNLDTRLNTLEISIADLQSRVKKLEGGSIVTTTVPTSKRSPVYVFSLGTGGSTTATDWITVSALTITVDPADYPGYTSMQLEALMKVLSGNGKAFTRLYESGNGLSVLSSEVSTEAYEYTWVSSPTFTVSAKKTFVFQLKSLTGYEAFINSARIKVNF